MLKTLLAGLVFVTTPVLAATGCADLKSLVLPNTRITLADPVAAGAFLPPPGGKGSPQQFADLPAFCRIQATLTPSSDSEIKIELWMPAAASWNGKFRGTGNGGLGGGATVGAGPLANALRAGYAAAGNNTGHEGGSNYAIGHPEKIKDFGYRSSHEMTVVSKALIARYYDAPLQYSVMAESGGGTIAALSAAQRYPEDYDALAVTSMSSYLSHHTFGQMWIWYATHENDASFIPPAKYAVLHQAALKACDAADGLADGIIGTAENCHFDPGVVQCKSADTPECLTAPQVAAARKIYRGGKLLLIGGWDDSSVPPDVAVNYYKDVIAKTGAKATRESMRFFMVPGMNHGVGTNGTENFNIDTLALIEQWKQTGKAPGQLVMDHYKDGKQVGRRLVCPYPQIARYKGSGNPEDPASFECK